MRGIMLDLETLGVNPGCVVLQIGAVEFDNRNILGTFKINIDMEDSVKRGLVIEPRTLSWWNDQSAEARASVFAPGVELPWALSGLKDSFDWHDTQVWCNGASFDFPIIGKLYESADMSVPWPYYNQMDFRTVKNLYSDVYRQAKVPAQLAHDALDDALAQARTLQLIFNNLGVNYDRQIA